MTGNGGAAITADALYPQWADFLQPDDIVIAETGTSSMGLAFAQMPKGATFDNQSLWSAIGWATPAAFGAAVAAPDRRVVLFTGDGSHQLTAQEISQMGRRGLKPTVFVLNNSGYLIERLLCQDPNIAYNESGGMALLRTAPRHRLRRLVHHPRHHLRRAGPVPAAGRPERLRLLHRSRHRRIRGTTATPKRCTRAATPSTRADAVTPYRGPAALRAG